VAFDPNDSVGADFALMAGVPARRVGWMTRHGERLDQELVGPATKKGGTSRLHRIASCLGLGEGLPSTELPRARRRSRP
jgi:hypothetical protein